MLYTGQHIQHTKMFDNTNFPWISSMSTDLHTIGDMLRDAGYYTAYKGKWHLTKEFETVNELGSPTKIFTKEMEAYGFSDYIGVGDIIAHEQGGYRHDGIISAMAVSWLRSRGMELAATSTPWFLAVNLVNPHDVLFYDTDAPGTSVRKQRGLGHLERDPVDAGPTTRCLVSIEVTPANPSIAPGAQQQFSAKGTYSDGPPTVDLTELATWTSSNLAVATITSPGGLATGGSWGPTTIQATWEGVTGSTQLTVLPTLHFSTFGNTNPPLVPGTADDADVYYYSGTGFSRSVDVTAITNPLPAATNVDGLVFVDATHFYMSFVADTAVPGLGTVQDEDVVYYNAGTWSVWFDGTAPGLTAANQDLDAISIVGGMYFSTVGNTNPPATPGGPAIAGTADNADIYKWNGVGTNPRFTRVVDVTAIPNPLPGPSAYRS